MPGTLPVAEVERSDFTEETKPIPFFSGSLATLFLNAHPRSKKATSSHVLLGLDAAKGAEVELIDTARLEDLLNHSDIQSNLHNPRLIAKLVKAGAGITLVMDLSGLVHFRSVPFVDLALLNALSKTPLRQHICLRAYYWEFKQVEKFNKSLVGLEGPLKICSFINLKDQAQPPRFIMSDLLKHAKANQKAKIEALVKTNG